MSDAITTQIRWADIRALAFKHRKALIKAHLLALLVTLCSVPLPLLLPLLVDEVLLQQGRSALDVLDHVLPAEAQVAAGYIGAMLLITLLLRALNLLFSVLQARLFARLAKDVVYRLRLRLLARLERIALAEYETLGGGTVSSHLVTDLATLDTFIGQSISRFLVSLLMIIGTAGILLWMHWQLALLILCFNPLVILLTVKLGKQVKELKRRENEGTSHFTQALTETLEAIQEVRAGNRQATFMGRLRERAREVRDFAVAAEWKSDAAGRASGVIFQLGIDVFRAAAMLTVLLSDLSIGQMLAVFSYLWFMIGPVEQLLSIQYAYYAADAARGRLNDLLARADEPDYPALHNPFAAPGGVSVEVAGLSFAYQQDPVLQDLNLSIAPGEKVALVGASGGGKSTLVQLLLGLYTPQSGQIAYGGVPLEQIGLPCVREHVAVVLQHPALFNDTLRANLTLGRERSDEACWQALEMAQLAPTVRAMAQGLDSVVGRQGVRLSGGQRQRLAVARMILANPRIVILDEATSALDAATEHALHQALRPFLQGRTTLIVAHRLSAVKQADRVLVFDGGRIAEQGGHRELLAGDGLYARLYGQLQRL
ncbi:ABC transporter ATP-binding protein [Atopomonas sediminilitoris]|uniref:ABC transporter ATP-binding protein n=1 Tax=Atopomonas sediminilitoris TaxID=2919919 RepID=UPI001F4EE72B|nr:ABC transporter ATP-binding protein [Atopomonas sediminilitoris]MCJ8168823.1 ABC transporter ATP-binding protein/permease [Atopomonas sediminilitoris]